MRTQASGFTVHPSTKHRGRQFPVSDLHAPNLGWPTPTRPHASATAGRRSQDRSIVVAKLGVFRSVAVVAGLFLLMAACGSSASKTTAPSSQGPSASSPTSAAPTGTPIKIGLIVSETGSNGSSSVQGAVVAPAWARYVNEQLGGIDGHPVQVIVENDAGDPAQSQAAEKKLVDSDGVVAIVAATETVPAWDADALSKGVPIVSGSANAVDWYSKPGMFVTVTDVLSGLSDQVLVAKKVGKATKFADVYCAEAAACGQANPPLEAAATKVGIAFTSLAIRANEPNYTAECLKLQQQKVDYAQLNVASSEAATFVQDCQQQGYNPTWGSSAQAIGKDLLSVPNLTLFGPAYAFPSVAQTPAAATFRAAMQRFAKNSQWAEGAGSFTWLGLEAIHKALGSTGPTVTAKDVMAGLYTLKGETLDGLAPNPLTWAPGKPVAFGSQPCSFVIGIKDGKTVAPNGLTPVCPSS